MEFEIRQAIRITTTPAKLRAVAAKMELVWAKAKLGDVLEAHRELDGEGGLLVFFIDQTEMEKTSRTEYVANHCITALGLNDLEFRHPSLAPYVISTPDAPRSVEFVRQYVAEMIKSEVTLAIRAERSRIDGRLRAEVGFDSLRAADLAVGIVYDEEPKRTGL